MDLRRPARARSPRASRAFTAFPISTPDRSIGLLRSACCQPVMILLPQPPPRAPLGSSIRRESTVGAAASVVAAHPPVRAALRDLQVAFARQGSGAVLDGRDIGTVIAPFANAKLFVTATPEVRAGRRHRQYVAQGVATTYEAVLADILARDARDQGRDTAPLLPAPDAVLLDTTDMSIKTASDAARRIVEAARGANGPFNR